MRFLREPLFHFVVLGAALFLVFGLVGESDESGTDRIVVTAGQIERLVEGWTRTWQRPPTARELEGLIQDHIREEVYYREALAMGLDRDDTVVRRRLRQKVEFLMEDVADAVDPTEEQLRDYFAENLERFRSAARLSFDHVYVNVDRRGEGAAQEALEMIARLEAGADPATLGDPFLLPLSFQQIREHEIGRQFGEDFSEGVAALPAGVWAGPVESAFGLHVVRVRGREESEDPRFENVRGAVQREWESERRKEAGEAFYESLRERYTISVEVESAEGGGEVPKVAEARR